MVDQFEPGEGGEGGDHWILLKRLSTPQRGAAKAMMRKKVMVRASSIPTLSRCQTLLPSRVLRNFWTCSAGRGCALLRTQTRPCSSAKRVDAARELTPSL